MMPPPQPETGLPLSSVPQRAEGGRTRCPDDACGGIPVEEERLAEQLAASGWSWRRRSRGRLTVDLHSPRFQGLATIEPEDIGLRVASEVCRWSALGRASRSAVTWVLRRASCEHGLVRPLLSRDEGEVVAEFEYFLWGEPREEELSAVFTALWLAGAACHELLRALGDETLAGRFLAISRLRQQPEEQPTLNERENHD